MSPGFVRGRDISAGIIAVMKRAAAATTTAAANAIFSMLCTNNDTDEEFAFQAKAPERAK